MPNPLKGAVTLKLDGREFTLVLDHEALIEAEALYRKPLSSLMLDVTLGYAGACRALLWAAMRALHPEVTPKEAATMFLGHMDEVGEALSEAAELAFPKDAEGKDDKNPPRPGKTSGGSGAKSGSSRKPSGKQRRARIN